MTPSIGAPVTVIGLGTMGSALANAFVAAGHPTTVWNRTPARADPLVRAGAQVAETVPEAVAASSLVHVLDGLRSDACSVGHGCAGVGGTGAGESMERAEAELGHEAGVDVSWQEPTWNMLRRAVDFGYGDQEISAVTEVLRERGGDGND